MKNEITFSTFYEVEEKNGLISFKSRQGPGLRAVILKKYFPYVPICDLSKIGFRHFPTGMFHENPFFILYDNYLSKMSRGRAEIFYKRFSLLLMELKLTDLFLKGKMSNKELIKFFVKLQK